VAALSHVYVQDLTGYITEGQIFIDRQLHNKKVHEMSVIKVLILAVDLPSYQRVALAFSVDEESHRSSRTTSHPTHTYTLLGHRMPLVSLRVQLTSLGVGMTREDHGEVSNQMVCCFLFGSHPILLLVRQLLPRKGDPGPQGRRR